MGFKDTFSEELSEFDCVEHMLDANSMPVTAVLAFHDSSFGPRLSYANTIF